MHFILEECSPLVSYNTFRIRNVGTWKQEEQAPQRGLSSRAQSAKQHVLHATMASKLAALCVFGGEALYLCLPVSALFGGHPGFACWHRTALQKGSTRISPCHRLEASILGRDYGGSGQKFLAPPTPPMRHQ